MKVAFVCPSYNGRRHKMHIAFKNHFDIQIFVKVNKRSDLTVCSQATVCKNYDNLVAAAIASNADVFHVFANSTAIARMLLQAGCKVVVDTHDLALMRTQDPDASYVYNSVAPKIFSSPVHLQYCMKRFNLGPNVCCIYNVPPRKWVSNIRRKHPLDGDNIVYYGGLHPKVGSVFGYRNYERLFRIFRAAGIAVHVYGTDAKRASKLRKIATIHDKLPYAALFSELTRYRVGFLGYAKTGVPLQSVEYAKSCVPNKAFDYMAAGIPSLAFNLGYSARFVSAWGVCIDDENAIVSAYHQAKKLDVSAVDRSAFLMDNHVELVRKMYEKALLIP